MKRAMCSQKAIHKKTTEEQMVMLEILEIVDGLANADEVRWYRHEQKRDDDKSFGNCPKS